MRADIVRVKAAQVKTGDTVAFYSPSRACDWAIVSVEKIGGKLLFNDGRHGMAVKPSDYVFIFKGGL